MGFRSDEVGCADRFRLPWSLAWETGWDRINSESTEVFLWVILEIASWFSFALLHLCYRWSSKSYVVGDHLRPQVWPGPTHLEGWPGGNCIGELGTIGELFRLVKIGIFDPDCCKAFDVSQHHHLWQFVFIVFLEQTENIPKHFYKPLAFQGPQIATNSFLRPAEAQSCASLEFDLVFFDLLFSQVCPKIGYWSHCVSSYSSLFDGNFWDIPHFQTGPYEAF